MDTPTPQQFIPTLHCITIPTPFSVGAVNVYLFQPAQSGEHLTLFDVGPYWPNSEQALIEGLETLGYSKKDVEQIVISHSHPDHYGLAGKLVRESGAIILSHPFNREIMSVGTGSSRPGTEYFYHEWLSQTGLPISQIETISHNRETSHEYSLPIDIDVELNEGDVLPLGGEDWTVLSTPGHSAGLICLFQPRLGVLLSSDHLIGRINSNPVIEPPAGEFSQRPKQLVQYLAQLERIDNLKPVIAFSGHDLPIQDVSRLIHDRLAFHQKRAEQIWEVLAKGPACVYELARRMYDTDKLPPVHLFLALSIVQGYLDLLETQGRVASKPDGSINRWSRI